jgi:hypothetical protein
MILRRERGVPALPRSADWMKKGRTIQQAAAGVTKPPLMKRAQSARIKAPSKGFDEAVATLLQVYRLRSFMKTCQAGRRRVPPW